MTALKSFLGRSYKNIDAGDNLYYSIGGNLLFIANDTVNKYAVFACGYYRQPALISGDSDYFGIVSSSPVQVYWAAGDMWGFYIKNNTDATVSLSIGALGTAVG